MHKGTNTIYYKKGKQKGFFIELHKKVGYRSFFSVGMSEHNLSTTYLTACLLGSTRKKYEKNFLFLFFYNPIPKWRKSWAQKVKLAEYFCV